MTTDQIDTLAESHEEELAEELLAAFVALLAIVSLNMIANALDDNDPRHIREQLTIILDLDDDGVPRSLSTSLDRRRTGLASFAEAIAALAAAQASHMLNPGSAEIHAIRKAGTDLLDRYLADTGDALTAAIGRAIYSAGTPESRARQLIRSIGLTNKQAHSLELMRLALADYLAKPRVFIPARTDATGRRTPLRYVRNVDPRTILAPLRGHISAAQRQMLTKALSNPKLTQADAEAILDKHANAMRRFRARATAGEGVHALTESAKLAGWQIAQRAGKLPQSQRRYWRTAGDERVRHSHRLVPGMNAKGVALDQPFATPLGNFMYPPLEWGCRCKAVLRGKP